MSTVTKSLQALLERFDTLKGLSHGKGLSGDKLVANRVKLHAAHAREAQVHHEKADEHDKEIASIIHSIPAVHHGTASKTDKKERAAHLAKLQHHVDQRAFHLGQKHINIFKAKQHFNWLKKKLAP